MNTTQLRSYLQILTMENPLLDFEEDYDERDRAQEWTKSHDEQNRVYERQDRKSQEEIWSQKVFPQETLRETMLFQLSGLSLSAHRQQILEYMIHSLDDSGYLRESPKDIAAALRLPLSPVEECLRLLQSLEPCGVGSRSLQECLSLQLLQNHPQEKTALLIVEQFLELLGQNRLPQISRKLHVPLSEVVHAHRIIRSLNPRPGASLCEREFVPYLMPDITVVECEGHFDVSVNDSACRLPPANSYYLSLCKEQGDAETTQYLTQKRQEIHWISTCIQRRRETLTSLCHLIISRQSDFFSNGPGYLHEFSQSEAASLLGVHQSTVSRAVKDKYLQCSFGVYPLQYFFVQGLEAKDQIRTHIQILIAQEDRTSPLSDSNISRLLSLEGLAVSRRVVAKYREQLRIPSASHRRSY